MVQHSGEMVKAALRSREMTQVELASSIGRDQTLISRYLSGQIEISDKAARAIADVLEIDFEELHHQLQRDRLERKMKRLGAEFKEVLDGSETSDQADVGAAILMEAPGAIVVPMLNFVPSSADDLSGKDTARYFLPPDMRIDPENSFAIRVSGENMIDDEVDEGDIIVVDCSANADDGDKVLAVVSGKPMLRKIYRRGETTVLQASGDSKEPVIFLSQKDDFEIVGRLALCTKVF